MARPNSHPKTPPRVWQRMLSGRRLDLINPSPMDIEIEDIAHGLARVARWNGQTSGAHAFSVAEHCVLVESLCLRLRPSLSARIRLAALLHDAPEYVIGDMISPFKAILGDDYKAVETRLEQAIHLRFGLPANLPPDSHRLIKQADRISAWFEAVQIAGFSEAEADRFFRRPPRDISLQLSPQPVEMAQSAFMLRFKDVLEQIDSEAA